MGDHSEISWTEATLAVEPGTGQVETIKESVARLKTILDYPFINIAGFLRAVAGSASGNDVARSCLATQDHRDNMVVRGCRCSAVRAATTEIFQQHFFAGARNDALSTWVTPGVGTSTRAKRVIIGVALSGIRVGVKATKSRTNRIDGNPCCTHSTPGQTRCCTFLPLTSRRTRSSPCGSAVAASHHQTIAATTINSKLITSKPKVALMAPFFATRHMRSVLIKGDSKPSSRGLDCAFLCLSHTRITSLPVHSIVSEGHYGR